MLSNSHAFDDPDLLSTLLGSSDDSVASPSFEMIEELDNVSNKAKNQPFLVGSFGHP